MESTATMTAELECAIVHREAGRYEEALPVLQHWIVRNPQDAEAYALLAQVLSLAKQPESAWTSLNCALLIDPTLLLVRLNHARLLLKQQNPKTALQVAQAAYQSDADNPESQLTLAATLVANGQDDRADQLLARALQHRPDYAEVYASRALIKLRGKDISGALTDAERALAIKPHLAQLWGITASLRHQLKDLPGAMDALQKAIAHEPSNVGYRADLGEFKRQTGAIEEAIRVLEQAVAIAPNNTSAWINLGTALQEFRQPAKARMAYAKALAIAPEHVEIANNLGALAKEEGDWDAAVRFFKQALQIKPDLAEAHSNLGVSLNELGQSDNAERSHRRALEIKPDYAWALNNLGNTLLDRDDQRQASVAYYKALDIDPINAGLEAAVTLAILHYMAGDLEQCRSKLLESQAIVAKTGSLYKYSRIYWGYLQRLLSWHQRAKSAKDPAADMERLYAVGESHALSAHGVVVSYRGKEMRCTAEWIAGCKQWHLGNDRSNRFKHKFERIMKRLPSNSIVLLCIGEIDCRHDDGILRVWRRHPENRLDEMVRATVDAYVDYVVAIAQTHSHQLIVGGVPHAKSPVNTLSFSEEEQLGHLIKIFNARLRTQALGAGLGFLDVYALTDRGEDHAGEWHIDDHHLLPSAVAEAFSAYYVEQ